MNTNKELSADYCREVQEEITTRLKGMDGGKVTAFEIVQTTLPFEGADLLTGIVFIGVVGQLGCYFIGGDFTGVQVQSSEAFRHLLGMLDNFRSMVDKGIDLVEAKGSLVIQELTLEEAFLEILFIEE